MASGEYDELLHRFDIQDRDLCATVTEPDLHEIATKIIDCDLRMISPWLDMEEKVARDIEIEHAAKDPAAKRLAYFEKWKKQKGSTGATYKKIVQAFLQNSSMISAEAICKLLQSRKGTSNTGSNVCTYVVNGNFQGF